MADLATPSKVKQQIFSQEGERESSASPGSDVSKESTVTQAESPERTKRKGKASRSKDCRYCIKNCKYNGKHKAAMVQCHICQIWAHYDCVHEKEEDIVGLWACNSCRNLSRNMDRVLCKVASLETSLKTLQENNQLLVQLVKEQSSASSNLETTNKALQLQVSTLQDELKSAISSTAITTQLDQLTAQMTHLNEVITREQSSPEESTDIPPTKSVVLLGDSVVDGVHGVTTSDGREVVVHTRPEATLTKLSEALDNEEIANDSGDIYLICGSSEAESDQSLPEIKKELTDLVSKAKAKCDSLTVSSVLPSAKPNARVDQLNKVIRDVCTHSGVTFTDNSENFLFKDNTRDGSMFRNDSDALTSKGLLRLLGNLGLAVPRLSATNGSDSRRTSGTRQNNAKVRQQGTGPTTSGVESRILKNRTKRPIHPEQRQRHNNEVSTTREDRATTGVGKRRQRSDFNSGTTTSTFGPYRPVPGQCANCGETNHVTVKCRHKSKVTCRACGKSGHKNKHHH